MAPTAMEALLGGKLQDKSGEGVTAEKLGDAEVVGIYFSAHWCGPCRGFTPKLIETYNTMKADGKKVEIVFASSDRDQAAFDDYYKDMPWLALPFAERDIKGKLSKKFKVRGIPSLVFIDREGNTLVKDGRTKVMSDPKATEFPWKPKPVDELLGNKFLTADGKTVDATAIKDKYLGLYFSAHWCPPCKTFTPKFADTYRAMKERGIDNFEAIFLSSDKDETSFDAYRKEQPWLALPFDCAKDKEALSERFEVGGIPTLVIVGPGADRPIINADGRAAVSSDANGEKFPWFPPLVPALDAASDINDTPFVVVLADGATKEAAAEHRGVLEGLAQVSKDAKEDLGYAIAEPGDDLVDRIRGMTDLKGDTSLATLYIDVQDNGAYYKGPSDVTADGIKTFIASVRDGTAVRSQL